jgi:hypothetical protein
MDGRYAHLTTHHFNNKGWAIIMEETLRKQASKQASNGHASLVAGLGASNGSMKLSVW